MLAKLLKRVKKEEKGFTLIELLAVIVILGIIAVIAIPMIGGIINNSKNDSDLATARQIYDASRMYIIGEENGEFVTTAGAGKTVSLEQLQLRNYIETGLVLPSTKLPMTATTTIVTFTATGTLDKVTILPTPAALKDETDKFYTAEQVMSSDLKATKPTE